MGNIFSGLQAIGDAISSVMQPRQEPQQAGAPQAANDQPALPELQEDAQNNGAAATAQQPAQPSVSDEEIEQIAQGLGNINLQQEHRGHPSSGSVNNVKKAQENTSSENLSLNQLLYLLRLEGIAYIEENVKNAYADIKKLQQSSDALTTLLAKVSDAYEVGTLDYTDNQEITNLMQQARDLGATVPEGTVLDKTQIESLVRNLEAKHKSIDTNTKLKLQEIDEYTRNRNNFYEVAKAIDDKISRAIEKILRAIDSK